MKKKLFLIFLLFLSGYLYSQDRIADTALYRASYKLIYQRDSTNIDSKLEEKMSLFIGKSYSLFQSENNRFNDSLVTALSSINMEDAQFAIGLALSSKKSTRFNYKIIKTSTRILVVDKIVTDKFTYEEKLKLKWEITNNTKRINNYLCQKATTVFAGRNYEAWFTNEIPINDGPYKFYGLPGLIIKIYDEKRQYDFELLSLEKYVSPFAIDLIKTKKISKKEYFKAYSNFKNNIVGQLEQRGIILDASNAAKVKQRIKKDRNNEIELIY